DQTTVKDGKPSPPDGGGKQPVVETKVGKALFTLGAHADGVYGVSCGGGGIPLIATGGGDKTAKTWNVTTGQETLTFRGHQSAVLAVALDVSGSRLVTGGQEGTLKVWNATTGGQPLHNLPGHTDAVRAVAFNRTGSSLVSASDDETLKVWDTASGALR